MVGDSYPTLVDFLSRLHANFRTLRAKHVRRIPKYEARYRRFERAQHVLARLKLIQHHPKLKKYRLELEARISQCESEADQLDDDFYLHPYNDVIGRLVRWTGEERKLLEKAVATGFEGQIGIVAKLQLLDATERVRALYDCLIQQHPHLSKACALALSTEGETPSVGGAAKSKKKASVEIVEAACRELDAADHGFKHLRVRDMVNAIKLHTGTSCANSTLLDTPYYSENCGRSPRRNRSDQAGSMSRAGKICADLASDEIAKHDWAKEVVKSSGLPHRETEALIERLDSGEMTPSQVVSTARTSAPAGQSRKSVFANGNC